MKPRQLGNLSTFFRMLRC